MERSTSPTPSVSARAPAAERRRRRERPREQDGEIVTVGITCAAVSFDGGQLASRPASAIVSTGWANTTAECRSHRRRSRRRWTKPPGGVRQVGTRQVRSAPSRVRRHEPHSVEQSLAPDRDPVDLRAAKALASRPSRPTGPISYWNRYVGVGQMGGHGSFHDPRIDLSHCPVSRSRRAEIAGTAAAYRAEPAHAEPPAGSFDRSAAGSRAARLLQGRPLRHLSSGPRTSPMS